MKRIVRLGDFVANTHPCDYFRVYCLLEIVVANQECLGETRLLNERTDMCSQRVTQRRQKLGLITRRYHAQLAVTAHSLTGETGGCSTHYELFNNALIQQYVAAL